MTRLSLALLLVLLASSLYLVNLQYQSRQLYTSLDKARSQARAIEHENERLQVDKRVQAAPLRVEKLAKEQLQMRTVTPAITHYVSFGVHAAADARPTPTQAPGNATGGRIQ